MAKAVSVYSGIDSLGRCVEVAQSAISGQWFRRLHVFNGYSYAWTKWQASVTPKFATRILNQTEYADAPEHIELSDSQSDEYIEWGFKTLRKGQGKPRVRLPF